VGVDKIKLTWRNFNCNLLQNDVALIYKINKSRLKSESGVTLIDKINYGRIKHKTANAFL
jgi:hypothetical protein